MSKTLEGGMQNKLAEGSKMTWTGVNNKVQGENPEFGTANWQRRRELRRQGNGQRERLVKVAGTKN